MKLGPSLLCFLHIIHGFYGNIELTCGTVNPLLPANVTCVCQYVGNGISWFHPNGTKLVNCFQSPQQCLPTINGFMFSIDSASLYRMTIINYRFSDCLYFSCRDISDSTIQKSARPSPSEFDSTTPVSLNEPNSNHSNGTITFTTACAFQYSKINYTWYIVSDGSERKYDIDKGRFVFESNNSSCNQCAGDALASLTIGFNHTEAGGKGAQKVLFQVKIHHKEYPLDVITLTSKHAYMVQVNDHRMSTPDNTDDNIYPIVIAAVFGLLLFVLGCVICIFCCFKEKEDNKSKVPDQVDDTHGKQENSNHSENDNKPSETQGNDFDNASFLEENNDIQDSNDVNPNTSKVPDQVGDTRGKQENNNQSESDNKLSETQGNHFNNASFLEENNDIQDSNDVNPNTSNVPDQVGDTHGKQENGNQSESDNKPSETQGNDFDNASFLEENNDIQDSNDVNPNTSNVPDQVGDTHGKQANSNHSENDNNPSETQGKDFDNSTYLGENIYDIQDSNDVNPNTSTDDKQENGKLSGSDNKPSDTRC